MRREWTVGVDFGGTNIKAGLVDRQGRVVRTEVLDAKRRGRPQAFVPALSRTVKGLARSVGVPTSRLRGVGIGAPGLIDVPRGVVHHLVNVPGWRNVPLARRLTERLGCPCVVDNDVNLVALGEWSLGAGRGAHHLVCLTLGTGVGGGLVLGGRLYRGASGSAGEIGHMVVEPGGRRCACGSRGCLETLVGSAAIVRAARAALLQGARTLRRLTRQAHGPLTPEVVYQAAASGDRAAQRIWSEVGCWLGVGIANLVNLLNPDRVVIGGGVAGAWRFLAPAMQRTVRAQAMVVPGRAVRIVHGQLGDKAGVIGAAVLVWQSTTRGVRRRCRTDEAVFGFGQP